MSKFIDPSTNSSRTTDHSDEITALYTAAAHRDETDGLDLEEKIQDLAAAALLEVHDATGISLDNWEPMKTFVNLRLVKAGQANLLPNGV